MRRPKLFISRHGRASYVCALRGASPRGPKRDIYIIHTYIHTYIHFLRCDAKLFASRYGARQLLVECYALGVRMPNCVTVRTHAKLEARITLWYVQCGTGIEKSPIEVGSLRSPIIAPLLHIEFLHSYMVWGKLPSDQYKPIQKLAMYCTLSWQLRTISWVLHHKNIFSYLQLSLNSSFSPCTPSPSPWPQVVLCSCSLMSLSQMCVLTCPKWFVTNWWEDDVKAHRSRVSWRQMLVTLQLIALTPGFWYISPSRSLWNVDTAFCSPLCRDRATPHNDSRAYSTCAIYNDSVTNT